MKVLEGNLVAKNVKVNDAFEEVNQLVGTVDPDTLAKLEKISINLEKQI